MDWTQFCNIVSNTDAGIATQELDFMDSNLEKFTMKYLPVYYRVEDIDLMRPDMISFKCYQSVRYWWVIMYLNNIMDCFYDLVVGDLLDIPNQLDIYDFFKKYAMRPG